MTNGPSARLNMLARARTRAGVVTGQLVTYMPSVTRDRYPAIRLTISTLIDLIHRDVG